MPETVGKIFSLFQENTPVPGCTVSRELWSGDDAAVCCFSLAEGTDISAELYAYHKLLIVSGGDLEVCAPAQKLLRTLKEGECLLTPIETPIGMRTDRGTVYLEIAIRRKDDVNEMIRTGEVFSLAELVPWQEGRIVNRDILHNDRMKFVVMAFDEGTGLAEHAAPGEALVFALEGKGIIGYEGKEHTIKTGEQFKFARNGKHWVKAEGKFKMALLLVLD